MKKMSVMILMIGVIINLIVPHVANALDCSLVKKKLSISQSMGHSVLIGERKLNEALNAIYDSLGYLACIQNYSKEIVEPIDREADNLGFIYHLQKLNEGESFNLYNEKVGKYIKDSSVELFIFLDFLSSYAGGNISESGGVYERSGNICTFTTKWGTVYFGCDKIYRVSNSPLASVSQLNELSLTNALTSLAYVRNIYDKGLCDKEPPPFESGYGTISMSFTENRIMKMSTNAPIMSKKLLEKAVKLDVRFGELVATCKKAEVK